MVRKVVPFSFVGISIKAIPPRSDPMIAGVAEKWTTASTKETIGIDADTFQGLCRAIKSLDNSCSIPSVLVECKVYFTQEAVSIDSEITLQVALK